MFVGDDSECGFYQQYLYPTTNLLKPSAQAPWEGAALEKLQRFVCTQGIKVSAISFFCTVEAITAAAEQRVAKEEKHQSVKQKRRAKVIGQRQWRTRGTELCATTPKSSFKTRIKNNNTRGSKTKAKKKVYIPESEPKLFRMTNHIAAQ